MTMRMFDLAGADPAVRFSPYCWRIKMALAHKGLEAETVAWRFTDKDRIAFSGQGLVPVLQDGETTVHDSWSIAEYLDATYADRPALLDGTQGRALASFARHWGQNVLTGILIKGVLMDIHAAIDEKDKAYFRESREQRFGMKMEDVIRSPDETFAQMKMATSPLRALLAEQPFIHGDRPAFGDYCIFGQFMWARNVSNVRLLDDKDPVYAWRERMLDLFDGLARRSARART
jgi:glutathione S-transferase